ncbi:UDP-glycosyltransferase 89B2 [Vitis vinifera]|uniref:UDP-glycosyltransferase 89B2 n=1 Tax=Vitis vinifera TaxID=29760 RepID=A0A438JYY6_VITVI|nr:UDP-glycosyltransferase 89B2 [Vitis vinifera]
MPNSPVLAWWQVSGLYRRYIERAPFSEFTKDIFRGNIASWGLVINSFTELERDYLDYLANELGHDRVWDVGPLHFLDGEKSGLMDRGGPSSVSADDILTWLDTCGDNKVVYACFGSQAEPTNEHVEGDHWALPPGFEDRVAGTGRGLIIRGWSPQVMILSHRAVGAFLTHCGWNSIIEGLVAGVSMLAWPMAADQFLNSILLVNELKVAVKVCEGAESVPDSTELARAVTLSVSENWAARERVTELRRQRWKQSNQEGVQRRI